MKMTEQKMTEQKRMPMGHLACIAVCAIALIYFLNRAGLGGAIGGAIGGGLGGALGTGIYYLFTWGRKESDR